MSGMACWSALARSRVVTRNIRKETHITTGAPRCPSTTLLAPNTILLHDHTASGRCLSLFVNERLTDDCYLITFGNERVSFWVVVWEHPSASMSAKGNASPNTLTPDARRFSFYWLSLSSFECSFSLFFPLS